MSLRTLINLRIVFSVILILLLGGTTAVWQARESVAKEVQSSITLALKMIEFGFTQTSITSRNKSEWLSQISALQQARNLQVSIALEGESPIQTMDKHALNEIEDRPPKWFVRAVSAEYLTERYEIVLADNSKEIVLITANPRGEISEAWGESKSFFWAIVIMLGVIFLAVNLVFNSMLRAVNSILLGLQQVGLGIYDSQLPHFKIGEFDAIAEKVNELSLALKKAEESNQALARHTMKIQETERQIMSRELHDEMGQSLTAIKAMAVTTKQTNADVPMVADSIIDICNHLAKIVRSMMKTLHPLSLAELGLGATLTDLVNEWHRRYAGLSIMMDYDEGLENLDKDIAIHVYRIVQECLTNVVRHADASEVSVIVTKRQDIVRVTVADNGNGGHTSQQGFGVLAMRERAESLGGKFVFESIIGKGVTVIAELPYSEESS